MGILEDVLGSVLGDRRRGGGMQGGGRETGLPGGLGGMLGGGSQGGMSPIMMALMALLTQRMSGRGGGGMGGGLGEVSGGIAGQQDGIGGKVRSDSAQQPHPSQPIHEKLIEDGIGNWGEFSGGHTGMDGLLERLERSGHGDKTTSWVSHGSNQPITPDELRNSLGDETVDGLSNQTGMPKDDLLSQLSELLPDVIDKLTPNGRRPDATESRDW